jgi:hypothetical protein
MCRQTSGRPRTSIGWQSRPVVLASGRCHVAFILRRFAKAAHSTNIIGQKPTVALSWSASRLKVEQGLSALASLKVKIVLDEQFLLSPSSVLVFSQPSSKADDAARHTVRSLHLSTDFGGFSGQSATGHKQISAALRHDLKCTRRGQMPAAAVYIRLQPILMA